MDLDLTFGTTDVVKLTPRATARPEGFEPPTPGLEVRSRAVPRPALILQNWR